MSSLRKRQIILFQLLATLIVTAVSCNSKKEEDTESIVVTYSTVAVKNFYIQANDSVMSRLDSVFFSIDLNTGVIFNADSLPKGTNISRLVPSITFANSMTKAELTFLKDNKTSTTVDYLTNPDDSIDFTNPVTLNVTAADGVNSFTYQIKVNVHKEVPDSLVWTRLATSSLPSRFSHPVAQKTILKDETAYCLIEEYNGEYTLSTTKDLNEGNWDKIMFDPGFIPDVETLTATSESYFITNQTGQLYVSQDLSFWEDTGEKWAGVLGAFGESVLGIKLSGEKLLHARYPKPDGYEAVEIDPSFPIYNSSSLGLIETKWASSPMGIIAGGVTSQGEVTSAIWGYDGKSWTILNNGYLPALEKPMLVRYIAYRETPYIFLERAFDVWLLFGGYAEDGEMNRKVYMSYDNGVTWHPAREEMQLSGKVPDLGGADAIVAGYPLTADLSEAWTPTPETKSRASYTIEGYDITWICPYMYIFGGYKPYPDNSLNTDIYRGVLQRLKFTPQI